MQPLVLVKPGQTLKVLCLGAHSDDIEIGVGGTILGWIASGAPLDVHWCVLSACGPRHAEAMAGADAVLEGAAARRIECAEFRDGLFSLPGRRDQDLDRGPEDARQSRCRVHPSRRRCAPGSPRGLPSDVECISRPRRPRVRDSQVGRRSRPAQFLYRDVSKSWSARSSCCRTCFGTQRSKDWFDAETFRGLARLRGMECRAPERYAEASCSARHVLPSSIVLPTRLSWLLFEVHAVIETRVDITTLSSTLDTGISRPRHRLVASISAIPNQLELSGVRARLTFPERHACSVVGLTLTPIGTRS